jgi:hypothetical protein
MPTVSAVLVVDAALGVVPVEAAEGWAVLPDEPELQPASETTPASTTTAAAAAVCVRMEAGSLLKAELDVTVISPDLKSPGHQETCSL